MVYEHSVIIIIMACSQCLWMGVWPTFGGRAGVTVVTEFVVLQTMNNLSSLAMTKSFMLFFFMLKFLPIHSLVYSVCFTVLLLNTLQDSNGRLCSDRILFCMYFKQEVIDSVQRTMNMH